MILIIDFQLNLFEFLQIKISLRLVKTAIFRNDFLTRFVNTYCVRRNHFFLKNKITFFPPQFTKTVKSLSRATNLPFSEASQERERKLKTRHVPGDENQRFYPEKNNRERGAVSGGGAPNSFTESSNQFRFEKATISLMKLALYYGHVDY